MSHHIHEHKEIPKPKSFLLYYWILWIISIIVLIVAKARNINEQAMTNLVTVYFLFSGLTMFVCNMFEGARLLDYLKEFHNKKWAQLTTVMGHSGGRNSFKTLGFAFSQDDLRDPNVKKLKTQTKLVLLFTLVDFISIPFVIISVLFR